MTEETPDNKDDRHQHRAGDLPWDVVSPTELVEYWTADGGHHLQVAAKAPWGVVAVGEAAVEFFRVWRPEKVHHTLTMSGPHTTSGFFTVTRSWDAFERYMARIGDDDLYGIRFRHPECGDLILTKDGVAPYEEPKREPSMLDNVTVIGISAEQLPLNAALLEKILSATPEATNDMMVAGIAAANAHPFDADGMIGRVQVRAIWDTMAALMPGLSIVGFEALKQALNKRNDDLLAANTRYQEAARQAKAERDEARQDAGNTERENMELRSIIFALYVAAGGPKIDIPDHAPVATLQTLAQHIHRPAVTSNLTWINRADIDAAGVVALYDKEVYIRTNSGIWRERDEETGAGHGFIRDADRADTWRFPDAWKQTAHCGPEKRVAFGYRAAL